MDVILFPVESSMMSHIGYDGETRTLTILFHSGKRYEYSGVEQEVFDGLRNATSPGSYFKTSIDDCYAYKQVRTRGRR
ncbi:KTSC domain-containing protein [Deinococcus sp. YIM 134068]|uniref:KTSC domain-containing protein n=1 Tax=Deinococcus lichenicola TaxID=3118910 RepID=UPI002F93DC54